jgi:uncharacterized protein YdeI (YjbR/CyaY-like superfamily)
MRQERLGNGVVHNMPRDARAAIVMYSNAVHTWNDITPLARNEWLCWVESAKKAETRVRRIRIMTENLTKGKRRVCCFAGCTHRDSSTS